MLTLLLSSFTAVTIASGDTLEMREWTVPWDKTRPRDPYVDDRTGRVWFVGQTGHYIAWLDPRTGEFKKYDLESGAGPHNLIVDAKGTVWFTGNRTGYIGRLDATTGAITRFQLEDSLARDPHTLIAGTKGELWFTVQGGGFVGRFDPATGKAQLIKTAARSRPYGIVIDRQGRPWFDLFGTNRIGMIDASTMTVKEYVLPDSAARPRRIGATADGMIWYGDYSRGYLGRLDPATGAVKEWALPRGRDSRPYAMATDDRGRVWVAETGPRDAANRLVGFDPKTETFFGITDVPSGGGTVRHMVWHPGTQQLWFGTDANTIGRAVVKPAPPIP